MDFVGDVNPFKESGAGVQFFSAEGVPAGQRLASVVGLVEELIVVPDPEYHWVDSFRTSRLSNERRQLLLYELSGKLRRQMGRKVLEAGGNHVLGYQQDFDLEGEHSGFIVARGLGTSVKLRSEADLRSLLSPRKAERPSRAGRASTARPPRMARRPPSSRPRSPPSVAAPSRRPSCPCSRSPSGPRRRGAATHTSWARAR